MKTRAVSTETRLTMVGRTVRKRNTLLLYACCLRLSVQECVDYIDLSFSFLRLARPSTARVIVRVLRVVFEL